MRQVIDQVRDANNLYRWNGVDIIGHRRSISEHSYEVAMISNNILNRVGADANLRSHVLEYALTHDLAEIFTNDVSYIAKSKSPELKSILNKLEENFMIESGYHPESRFSTATRLIVKTADIIAVGVEIQEQLNVNNTRKFDLNNVETIIDSVLDKYRLQVGSNIWQVCATILTVEKPWLNSKN